MKKIKYDFMSQLVHIFSSGQSKSVTLTGNIKDLFYSPAQDDKSDNGIGEYMPLLEFLLSRWMSNPNFIKIVYEFNKPVKFLDKEDIDLMRDAWAKFKVGASANYLKIKRFADMLTEEEKKMLDGEADFDNRLQNTAVAPSFSLEFLKQLCMVSRAKVNGKPILKKDLVIIIDGANMLAPFSQSGIAGLSEADRTRVALLKDWFSDPEFTNANDSVVLITETKGMMNEEVHRLPQVLEVKIQSPNTEERLAFISWFFAEQRRLKKQEPKLWGSQTELAYQTAGLTIQALMQLLKGCVYAKEKLQPNDVIAKVGEFIQQQLGEENIVKFQKFEQRIKDIVGNSELKGKNKDGFLYKEFMPAVKSRSKHALSAAVVAGPNRSGKSFIFGATAAELGMSVLTLGNVRSMWFGGTDLRWDRLERLLVALDKVMLNIDEADTQFGQVSGDIHQTEKRLTGKIQNMMSDPKFRGKVFWLLITARIHLLSPDIRQPGRAGDMIIPIGDPVGDDFKDFVNWVVNSAVKSPSDELIAYFEKAADGYSAGAFDVIRRELLRKAAERGKEHLDEEEFRQVVSNRINPKFTRTRRIQTLYALLNCTHLSLIPRYELPNDWEDNPDIERAHKAWIKELAEYGIEFLD